MTPTASLDELERELIVNAAAQLPLDCRDEMLRRVAHAMAHADFYPEDAALKPSHWLNRSRVPRSDEGRDYWLL